MSNEPKIKTSLTEVGAALVGLIDIIDMSVDLTTFQRGKLQELKKLLIDGGGNPPATK